MTFSEFIKSTWPAAAVGVSAGLATAAWSWLHAGPAAGIFAAGASLISLAASGWIIGRQRRDARARLRHPELRTVRPDNLGPFQELVDETVPRLEKLAAEHALAVQGRTELEALLRVRQIQIRRLDAAFQSFAEPLLMTDSRDELVFWNQAAARLLGSKNQEPPRLDAIPKLRELIVETRSRATATRSRSVEMELAAGDQVRNVRATATSVTDPDQAPLGVVLAFHDIAAEKAEKTRHAEFVSSVAHELKTPLAGMKAFIEMLIDGEAADQAEQAEMYGFIDIQIDRLTRLINNMLNLARVESGVIKVDRVDCGLGDVLQKALTVVAPMAEEKQIRLIPELSGLYIPVHIDTDLFGQAVINLLSNAIKYTPQGGTVWLQSRMEEEEAVIEVRDTGMGIPAESLSKLFQRFYRVPQNNQAAAGTGLGLALVQYIVTAVHNGRINVESQVGEGSCFTVTLPLAHRHKGPPRRRPEPAACPV